MRSTTAPRTIRMHVLRRLEHPSIDEQRELSRLEELPWPSGRALVSYDRPREPRRLVPLSGYSPAGKA
jgi:hypothetical protein